MKYLPGTPDIVLPKYNSVIFINGCFWHGHKNCKAATLPKSNQYYWSTKIDKNIKRDNKNTRELKKLGWQVIIIWECETKKLLKGSSTEQLKLLSSIQENQHK